MLPLSAVTVLPNGLVYGNIEPDRPKFETMVVTTEGGESVLQQISWNKEINKPLQYTFDFSDAYYCWIEVEDWNFVPIRDLKHLFGTKRSDFDPTRLGIFPGWKSHEFWLRR
jgi:hypothetical protein